MNVKPLKERVLIKPKHEEEKTTGGIYIPDTAKGKTQEGVVVAIGECEKCQLKVGDKVIFESYAGTEIKVNGEKHLIMEVKDVLAVLS